MRKVQINQTAPAIWSDAVGRDPLRCEFLPSVDVSGMFPEAIVGVDQ